MRVLVTGGAGYLGYSLTNYLNELGDISEVIVYDNLSRVHPNFFLGSKKLNKTTFIKGDILNTDKLIKILKNIDVVYHLAAHTPFPKNHLENFRYEQINQWGTLNVVNAIKRVETVKKIIFLSTSAVYGNRHEISPEAVPQPQNAYSKSKYEAEKYVKALSEKCEINVIRSGNIFGYNLCFRLDAVINNFIFESIVNKKIQIYGNGKQMRPFIHIDTLCMYLVDLLEDFSTSQTTKTIADFNSNLNQIKQILLDNLPELEYIYLNQNLSFDSHSLHKSLLLDKGQETLIKKSFLNFKNHIRIK
ncbi:NAD-dependent epimerase/dehydratase family protein [Fodinibius salsisoli]|uniref:SDR family oxidoreductase n=1 Tax=Fodinibius salsisoli TaxID=2820877 RepID=A0ABT3PTD2_9BACT|nr:SDR family oxidoreductase [Fodinibius salsisoli]MCW9709132.1 SDR family oxidoreductase [Fodinibius salsisoli]